MFNHERKNLIMERVANLKNILFFLFIITSILAALEMANAFQAGIPKYSETKILPSDGAEDDYFSYIVSISGDYAIVGNIKDDDNGTDSGSAYIYKKRAILPFLFLHD